ncbi:Na+/H+ antiporter subunit D [Nosocomiicoccus ampullae]|uniref:Na+/H+ antiporter subunit D n=1 Tax=Nosocomiicoccus ampullae TaxID=489910 RepID=UPI001C5F2998|nr:Na+/H+ antiporter subunit D [Nosocomiicoccus ampullae]QYA48819.1 Na+/H+ antiporter subunit D [Nosocomiicoccus ampullae]
MVTNVLLILPLIIPGLAAVIMLFANKRPVFHRVTTTIASLMMVIVSIFIVRRVYNNGVLVTNIGDWPAPFGISVVYDMLSAMLVLTTSIILFFVTIYSFQSIGVERERYFYHPMMLFMIMGINGAFTTGDIFNMFVFFEVFLIASYVLLTIGSSRIQLREGFKYLIVNVISSNILVLGIGYLYSVVGSVNMADIQVKLSNYDGNLSVITLIGAVIMFVFLTKAAIFPLYFWLPDSYNAPPIPILAAFGALLTKVGVYALMRTYSLFFSLDFNYISTFLVVLSILTIIIGSIGALASYDLKMVVIYNIIIAIGFIVIAVAMLDMDGMLGSIYYLIHDMIIKTALFLLVGFIIYRTGKVNAKEIHGLMSVHPVTGWFFFLAGLSLAGVPPFPGFFGKVYIVKSLFLNEYYISGIVILFSSLVILYSIMRLFIQVFFGAPANLEDLKPIKYDKLLFSAIGLVVVSIIFGLSADLLYPYFEMAAQTLTDPSIYSEYIMGVE